MASPFSYIFYRFIILYPKAERKLFVDLTAFLSITVFWANEKADV
jgi:hypothetical protein